jgi:hypothetical protein
MTLPTYFAVQCRLSPLWRKYGRVSTASVQGGWTPGWHCWLAQQCLLFSSQYGTGFRQQSRARGQVLFLDFRLSRWTILLAVE